MAQHGFAALPVVDAGNRLVGIVAEADVLRNRLLEDPRLHLRRDTDHHPDTVPLSVRDARRRGADLRERLPAAPARPSPSSGSGSTQPLLRARKLLVVLESEGLGGQSFHSRIVLLVNRHTASAAEMIVAFARENGLATIIGEKTAGRLLSRKSAHAYDAIPAVHCSTRVIDCPVRGAPRPSPAAVIAGSGTPFTSSSRASRPTNLLNCALSRAAP